MPDFDFSTLITDRSPADLEALRDLLATPMADWTAEQLAQFNQAVSKGAYNYTDLNRVTACMDYLNERLTALGYVTGYHPIIVHPETPPPTPTLPEGYTELEYIESSGTQYIDTGFKPNQNTRCVCGFRLLSDDGSHQVIFGSRVSSGSTQFVFGFAGHSSKTFRSDYGSGNVLFSNNIPALGNYTVDKNKSVCSLDDETVNNKESTFSSSYNLFVFACNTAESVSNFTSMICTFLKIYDNDTIARDLIPCVNDENTVGLYDLVNNIFYPNLGSGTFTAGPEVPQPEPEPTLDPYTWYEEDVPMFTQMQRYLSNVSALRGALELPEDTVCLPADMTGLTQMEANNIEIILGALQAWIENMIQAWFYSGDLYAGEV